MTLANAIKVAKIIETAEGGCGGCINEAVRELEKEFPEFKRIIDPSTWAVLDSYLADAKRKYAKSNAGYDPEAFKDRKSLAKAAEIEALMQPEIDRRVAEERAKLLQRLRDDLNIAIELIQEAKGYEGPKGGPITDHLDAAEGWIDRVLAQFEKENSHEQG